MAASLHPPIAPKDDDDGPLWFAIGAGISVAAIAVAIAVT